MMNTKFNKMKKILLCAMHLIHIIIVNEKYVKYTNLLMYL
jgi:hypothetical protein